MEWVLRSCLLGIHLSELLGLTESERQDVYYLTLLRHAGCTANAVQDAAMFGDETAIAELMTADPDNMAEMVTLLFRLVGKDQTPLRRAGMLARIMLAGPGLADSNHAAHCEIASQLAARIGFSSNIQSALWQMYERWDGRGTPNRLRGVDLLPSVRVIHLAQDVATFYAVGGIETAVEVAQQRSGRLYDPAVVDIFCREASTLLTALDGESTWDAVLASEPGTPVCLTEEQTDNALVAVADFADMKSPHTLGHSRSVSQLAEAAGLQSGLPATDTIALRRAGLVHDLGKVGITSAIWNKSGSLSETEWERVRLHPYYTERILARSPTLTTLGTLSALHHERLDGSGYHRGVTAMALSLPARVLAAANIYCSLTESRAYRPACSPEAAADALRREVRAGRLDAHATDAVLSAAGHRIRGNRRSPTTDLSNREIEVLRLVARGLSNRQMAAQLSISEKTVGHHIQHIYNKIGVSTRAGATLFAVQNHLLTET
jgi:HD-GYP domain-containing protein (c-di-GMP phosphodiesterase class II)